MTKENFRPLPSPLKEDRLSERHAERRQRQYLWVRNLIVEGMRRAWDEREERRKVGQGIEQSTDKLITPPLTEIPEQKDVK